MTAPGNISGIVGEEDMALQPSYILSFCSHVFLILLLVDVDQEF